MSKKPILLFIVAIIVSVLFLFFQNSPGGLSEFRGAKDQKAGLINRAGEDVLPTDTLKESLKNKTQMDELESRLQISKAGLQKECTDFVAHISQLKPEAIRMDLLSGKLKPPEGAKCATQNMIDTMSSLGLPMGSCMKLSGLEANESEASGNKEALVDSCMQELLFLRGLIVANAVEKANLKLKNMSSEELASMFLKSFFEGIQDKTKAPQLNDISQELLERYPTSLAAHQARLVAMFMNMKDMASAAADIADLATSGLSYDSENAEMATAYLLAYRETLPDDKYELFFKEFAESHPNNYGVLNVQASRIFKGGDIEGAISFLENAKQDVNSTYHSQIDETIRKIHAGGKESPFAMHVGFRFDDFYN